MCPLLSLIAAHNKQQFFRSCRWWSGGKLLIQIYPLYFCSCDNLHFWSWTDPTPSLYFTRFIDCQLVLLLNIAEILLTWHWTIGSHIDEDSNSKRHCCVYKTFDCHLQKFSKLGRDLKFNLLYPLKYCQRSLYHGGCSLLHTCYPLWPMTRDSILTNWQPLSRRRVEQLCGFKPSQPSLITSYMKQIDQVGRLNLVLFVWWCLTPLSLIFPLYRGGQFYWWRKL